MTDADGLYSVPLEDFVAERKRVAKTLRDAGDREAAAEIARFPKPSPPAWALNRFARDQPEVVGTWLDVAAALRAASADPGPELREAMAAHREATAGLVAAVREHARPNGRPLSEPMLERVRALLQVALTDAGQGERLRAGQVVEGADEDAAPLPEPAPRPARAEPKPAAKGKTAAQERRERQERERAERIAELERRVEEARDQLERREAEADERDAAAAAAGEQLEEARRTLHRSESEASAAEAAAQEARTAASEAERELKTLTASLRKAGGAAPS